MVSFRGRGYLELKSQDLRRNSSFGLSFRTEKNEGLLLASTFQGQEEAGVEAVGKEGQGRQAEDLGNYYSISMIDGRIVFLFGSSSNPGKPLEFTTPQRYNDGRLHTINVLRRDRM